MIENRFKEFERECRKDQKFSRISPTDPLPEDSKEAVTIIMHDLVRTIIEDSWKDICESVDKDGGITQSLEKLILYWLGNYQNVTEWRHAYYFQRVLPS